ncbi:hypothetical protein [Nibricoccus sp. IMCC34717]|uniref:hypothetical protein n=1 Tax=Nibricoccus sp. IMCC34717 TaxID=3034021 RepID=UPI00384C0D7A
MSVYGGKTFIGSNDNWTEAGLAASFETLFTALGAFPFSLNNPRDSAVHISFRGSRRIDLEAVPGTASGVALMELFDTTNAASSKIVHIGALCWAGTGNDQATFAFTLKGSAAQKVLVRVIGPTLGLYQITGAIPDPSLELYQVQNGANTLLAKNDNWDNSQTTIDTAARVGAFEILPASKDATLITTLQPGVYSLAVRSVTGAAGRCLLEIYLVP